MTAVALAAATVRADVDGLQVVYDINAVGSTAPATNELAGQLGGFGYDPVNNRLYVAVVGSAQGLFRIDNVATPTVAATRLVSVSQYQGFTFGKQPVPFGLALNPVTFNGRGPYTTSYLVDAHGVGTTGDNTTSRRFYSWNLQADTGIAGSSTALSAVLSGQDIITASGAGTANPAVIRQPRFGNDGKSVYFGVGTSNTNGVYRYDATTNKATRLPSVSAAALGSQEVGVQRISATVDRILFADGAQNLVYIDYDSAANSYSTQKTLVSAATVRDFVRGAAGQTFSINNVVTDAGGNVYFQAGTSQVSQQRNVFLRYDEVNGVGRLAKVLAQNEIKTVRPNQGASYTGVQMASGTYTSGGTSFPVGQMYYGNPVTGSGYIARANLFLPGDFNRDNVVNAADGAMLASSGALKPIGTAVPISTADNSRYDLNGDASTYLASTPAAFTSVVDYYDVKALQQFLPFADGDANFDLALNFTDINAARDNYLGTGRVWTQGNFNADDVTNALDLQLLAFDWVYALHQPALTAQQIDAAGYTGVFRNDLLAAFNLTAVPEPATLGLLAAAGTLLARRKRRA